MVADREKDSKEYRAGKLKEACDALDSAREQHKTSEMNLMDARHRHTGSLNRLNNAQKEFDKVIAEIREKSTLPDTDWYKKGRTNG